MDHVRQQRAVQAKPMAKAAELGEEPGMMLGLEGAGALQLQAAADESPQVRQLRGLQDVANASPQVGQLRRQQDAANSVVAQRQENRTGLPDNLKSGIESLSGIAMDDVRVHYNSDKPAQLQAHAFAQGSDIHLAAGQERHLPHEAWHVVQQRQGRVKPTLQLKGVAINDDDGLEREADVMGGRALRPAAHPRLGTQGLTNGMHPAGPVQMKRPQPVRGNHAGNNVAKVWLSSILTHDGHQFEIKLNEAFGSRAAIMAHITGIVQAEGKSADDVKWVTTVADYDKAEIKDRIDPYRLHIEGKYGDANVDYAVEVHFGPYHHGYIVHVMDGVSDAEIHNEAKLHGGNAGNAGIANFSSTHHSRGANKLMDDTALDPQSGLQEEQKLDANTKIIGEGARFAAVKAHAANLTDNSKFFIRLSDDNATVRWITFQDLWLTWSATFGKQFGIPDSDIAAHLVADDFKRLNGMLNAPEDLKTTTGVPTDIGVGTDYSLNDHRAATEDYRHKWKTIQLPKLTMTENFNQTRRSKLVADLKAVQGVMAVRHSQTGATVSVDAWDEVDMDDVIGALPEWAELSGEEDDADAKAVAVVDGDSKAELPPANLGPRVQKIFFDANNMEGRVLAWLQELGLPKEQAKGWLGPMMKRMRNKKSGGVQFLHGKNGYQFDKGFDLKAYFLEISKDVKLKYDKKATVKGTASTAPEPAGEDEKELLADLDMKAEKKEVTSQGYSYWIAAFVIILFFLYITQSRHGFLFSQSNTGDGTGS